MEIGCRAQSRRIEIGDDSGAAIAGIDSFADIPARQHDIGHTDSLEHLRSEGE